MGTSGNNVTLSTTSNSQSITVPYATTAGNANTVNGNTVGTSVPTNAVFTDHIYYGADGNELGLIKTGAGIVMDDGELYFEDNISDTDI